MRVLMKWMVYGLLMITVSLSYASSEQEITWYTQNSSKEVMINVDLFASSTCPHCQKAEAFFTELSASRKWISLNRHIINQDKTALKDFFIRLRHFHSNNFAVPTIMFCNSRWLGFDSAETTGKVLLKALEYCHKSIKNDGKLTVANEILLQKWSATGPLDIKMSNNSVGFSTLGRVVLTAFVEAFSPCSLFCFFVFISFVWMHPERRKMQFILGLGFIITLGVLHFIQLGFFEYYEIMQRYATWPNALTGTALLIYVYYYRKSSQLGGTSISWKWIIPIVIFSTSTVFIQQQICELNVGAVFGQWLQAQNLTPSAYYFYQLMYHFFYLTSMMLLLCFYLVFGVHPKDLLRYTGMIILTIIGVLLLFYPIGLSYLGWSCGVIIIALFVAWFGRLRLG